MSKINLTKSERDVLVNMIGYEGNGQFKQYIVDILGTSWFVFERIRYPITLHKVRIVMSLIGKGILAAECRDYYKLTDIGRETIKQLKDEKKNTIQR